MKRPPLEHNLDEQTSIEETAEGFALITPLVQVNLTETLAHRLTLNVLASKRRAEKLAANGAAS